MFKGAGHPGNAGGGVDAAEITDDAKATIREVSERLVENLVDDPDVGHPRKTPKYGRAKSARIHEFSEEAPLSAPTAL
jgi:hypothetical protein